MGEFPAPIVRDDQLEHEGEKQGHEGRADNVEGVLDRCRNLGLY